MQENLETMNQEATLYLWQDNLNNLLKKIGRMVNILPIFLVISVGYAQNKNEGILISDFEYSKIEKKFFSVRGNTNYLPAHYSLKQYAPKPLNQLEYPTSAAWATSYAALSIIDAQQTQKKSAELNNSSFSPLFPYYYAFDKASTAHCGQRVSIPQVLTALKRFGSPRYRAYPVRCITHSPDKYLTAASANRISEFTRLFEVHATLAKKIHAIKATLADNLPVVVAMHYDKSFAYAKDFWQPREAFDASLPAKALCVVGYDDSKFGGAFEVMNSVGDEWGNEGFIWIPYQTFIEYVRHAFSLYLIPSRGNETQLAGGIDLELVNGDNMELVQLSPGYYKIKNSYPSGTRFKIRITNHSPGFLYVFASDLSNEIFPLFPPSSISAAFSNEAYFYVPDENTPIEIDENLGTDYLCVLFSKEDLDINTIFATMKSTEGSFKQKVAQALEGNLIDPQKAIFATETAEFRVPEASQTTIALIIEHDHR